MRTATNGDWPPQVPTVVTPMDPELFARFSRLVYEQSGIVLRDGKESLVSARISKRMRALGITSAEAYLHRVEKDATGEELVLLLDAISTNLTSFFREPDHFVFFRDRIREWSESGQQRFRIWCAASSTGEEPYTIAMVLDDVLGGRTSDTRILATDISTRVLGECRRATYAGAKVQTVPEVLRRRYFHAEGTPAQRTYRVCDELREMILFRRLNLSQPPFPMKGPMDIVFCRNVMIYFDQHVRGRLIEEIYRLLKPGGYLIVGHSESLIGLNTGFNSKAVSIYQK